MTLTQPAPPISFNVSREDTSAGVFVITALPNSSDMTASEDDITAYIFRVEYENGTRYVLQVNYSSGQYCIYIQS